MGALNQDWKFVANRNLWRLRLPGWEGIVRMGNKSGLPAESLVLDFRGKATILLPVTDSLYETQTIMERWLARIGVLETKLPYTEWFKVGEQTLHTKVGDIDIYLPNQPGGAVVASSTDGGTYMSPVLNDPEEGFAWARYLVKTLYSHITELPQRRTL